MVITKIIAAAQSGFNHPFEQFANFKPSISLEAMVEPGENAEQVARNLQQMAQGFCDAERARIEAKLHREKLISETKDEIRFIPHNITRHQGEIEMLKKRNWDGDAEQIKRLERAIQILEAQKPVFEKRLSLLKEGAPIESLPAVPDGDSIPF